MKGSSFGHSKQRRRPVYEGSHSALIFSNEGTSDLGPITHMGPSTQSTNPSVQDVTTVAVGLEFTEIWSEHRAVSLPVEMPLHSFPRRPITQTQ